MTEGAVLTPSLVAELCGGVLVRGSSDEPLSEVVVDSRGTLPDRSLFVAVEGEHFDGHEFVGEAALRGASAALVSRPVDGEGSGEISLIMVEDTVEALQALAREWRKRFELPVVAVTGSNGKTIVKDMLAGILAQSRTVHRSPGSYNSQIGVALSLLGIRPEHEIAVIEAGISQVDEMPRLEAMIGPTHGLLTNIGLAHAAGLPTLEVCATEKLRLFEGLGEGPLVLPAGDPSLKGRALPGKRVTFEVGGEAADYGATKVRFERGGYTFDLRMAGERVEGLRLNTPGLHNVANAAAAAAMAREIGVDTGEIREGLAAFELSPMRLEMHTTQTGVTLINDAYSSDPPSARAALATLRHYAGEGRRVAILGDMLDLGGRSRVEHRALGAVVARGGVDVLVCYGERAREIGRSARDHGLDAGHIFYASDLEELHALLGRELRPEDFVLFKASRTVGLERAAQRLLESVAPARLCVDLAAVRQNYHKLRRRVGPGVGFIAVVKGFGYGNDATRVSQALVREGVEALAVAYADEAIPLRMRGLSLPILVTHALASEADKIVKYGLTPFVYSRDVVEALRANMAGREGAVRVHVEVNTGMNRGGIRPRDAVEFIREIEAYSEVEVEGLATHFAAADDPREDAFTRAQVRRFDEVIEALDRRGLRPEVIHAANTAAAWRWPGARYDSIRVGLGLYGLSPSEAVAGEASGVRPALSLTTRVIHLEEVAKGESVGYGRSWRAKKASRLATIAMGYNDGLPRFMSNGGQVLIGGERCEVVGRVCMDVAVVDVSEVEEVEVGDEVVIFGRQGREYLGVDEMAERGQTINYEILCNISPRVRRIFVHE